MTPTPNVPEIRRLSRTELVRLIAPHARGIANVFDARAKRQGSGIAVESNAVDEVVSILVEHAQPAILDIIAAARGESLQTVRAMSGLGQFIAFFQILGSAFPDHMMGEIGAELVPLIAEAATGSSALASGHVRRH